MLGEELKRRREELGVSLVEISEATRIGTRFLKAIETENYAALPGGIFTRSFIRAYAKEVGMNADQAVARYQEESGTLDKPASDPTAYQLNAGPGVYDEPSNTFWSSVLIALAAALILGMGGWAVNHYMNRASAPEATTSTNPDRAPVASSAAPLAKAPSENLTLTLRATGSCWVQYAVDGGSPTQISLKEGDSRSIEASEQIDLSVGNTRALSLRVNEREAHFPENTPVVLKRITITPETVSALLD
jgi:cytoskeleton protein RodZ